MKEFPVVMAHCIHLHDASYLLLQNVNCKPVHGIRVVVQLCIPTFWKCCGQESVVWSLQICYYIILDSHATKSQHNDHKLVRDIQNWFFLFVYNNSVSYKSIKPSIQGHRNLTPHGIFISHITFQHQSETTSLNSYSIPKFNQPAIPLSQENSLVD